MKEISVTVPVSIDAKIFRDFALFDGFFRRRRWRPLALFTGILLSSALVCFLMRNRAEQAVFLGSVLALVGIGLPVAYVLSFLSSIRQQSKKMRLATGRHAYTIFLSDSDGIAAEVGKERLTYRWEDVFAIYHLRRATYLYVTPGKAYLLPDAQVPGGAKLLWDLFEKSAPAGRVFLRKSFGNGSE